MMRNLSLCDRYVNMNSSSAFCSDINTGYQYRISISRICFFTLRIRGREYGSGR